MKPAKGFRDYIGMFAVLRRYARGDKPVHQFLNLPLTPAFRAGPSSFQLVATGCARLWMLSS